MQNACSKFLKSHRSFFNNLKSANTYMNELRREGRAVL